MAREEILMFFVEEFWGGASLQVADLNLATERSGYERSRVKDVFCKKIWENSARIFYLTAVRSPEEQRIL